MKRTLALPLTALALVAGACTNTADAPEASTDGTDTTIGGTNAPDDGTSEPRGPVGFAPASLQRFGDCDAFIDHVHTEGADRVGPYGFDQGGYFGPEIMVGTDDFAVDEDMAETEAASSAADVVEQTAAPSAALPATSAGDESDFSTTNVQVEGVDEPDIVKTDGERIIAIAGETLHYIEISDDGRTGTLRGSVQLNGDPQADFERYTYGHEIFLAGDRVFVFAQGDGGFFGFPEPFPVEPELEITRDDVIIDDDKGDEMISDVTIDTPEEVGESDEPGRVDAEESFADEPIPVEPDIAPIGGPVGYRGQQTVVIEIDVSNPDAPVIANTMRIDGRYVSARAIGDTARLVITSPPQDLGFLYPSNADTEDRAEAANRQVILESTASDWIPDFTVVAADGTERSGEVSNCANVHAPADFSGFDMLSVVTIDLGSDLGGGLGDGVDTLGGASVLASGETVYASQDRLYVSTNIWEPIIDEQSQQWLDENYQTALHRFSISGTEPAAYEASGSIEGHLLNQFSMNDRDGILYAATTLGAPWGGEDSVSQIVALEMNGDRLEQIGSVGGLGETERIFSVRYVDDTAYVVTFRQIDPFYIVDLADPRNMTVQGELKIPGYSSYLHPISDDFVLGVGQDATDEGFTTGTKVSLFDVSNPADPQEVDVWTLPNAFSDAEFDHRAFLWWAPTNTAVLPLQSWSDQFSGAVVLNIVDGQITEQGRVTQADDTEGVVGQTDCDVLGPDDLDDPNGELSWIFEGGQQINLCTANQTGGAVSLFCEVVPAEELEFFVGPGIDFDTAQYERVEFCYPEWDGYRTAVQRTLVIDGNLWTLSPERLQSNDLTTLDRNDAIDLT